MNTYVLIAAVVLVLIVLVGIVKKIGRAAISIAIIVGLISAAGGTKAVVEQIKANKQVSYITEKKEELNKAVKSGKDSKEDIDKIKAEIDKQLAKIKEQEKDNLFMKLYPDDIFDMEE